MNSHILFTFGECFIRIYQCLVLIIGVSLSKPHTRVSCVMVTYTIKLQHKIDTLQVLPPLN